MSFCFFVFLFETKVNLKMTHAYICKVARRVCKIVEIFIRHSPNLFCLPSPSLPSKWMGRSDNKKKANKRYRAADSLEFTADLLQLSE